jgi:ATP-binding cassette, subfamily G (WHITE), member 2
MCLHALYNLCAWCWDLHTQSDFWVSFLQAVASKFIIFLIFMCFCSLSATSAALAISTLCRTTDMSVAVLPMIIEVTRLFGGFFLSPSRLPNYFSWLDALSYIKYSYVGISLNELQGLELYCTESQLVQRADGSFRCPITRGEQTIDSLGLDFISVGGCAGVLIGLIIFSRVVAYLGLRFLKN